MECRLHFLCFLYPAGNAFEGRLREEFQKSLFSAFIATNKENLRATQWTVQHKGERYICNGLKAIFTDNNGNLSQLTLFESGTWFYKIRITTNQADTALISNLEEKILQKFDPTQLARIQPLEDFFNIYVAQTAFRDSVLLGSVLGSINRKTEWIRENVSENERATGFSDLHLNLHIESLKAFMAFQHRTTASKSEFTRNYLNELQAIFDAGFLAEFVMEQFDFLLIVPENMEFRFDEYEKWKSENPISINLNEKFYVIEIPAKN